MSKKRRSDEAPLPATSAGLIRFFEEESAGIKISPFTVVIIAVFIIIVVGFAVYLSSGGEVLKQLVTFR
ncbi:MAG: preprotein translocase subunit Sec61beta [Candidatus Jordarchaeales archaeon]